MATKKNKKGKTKKVPCPACGKKVGSQKLHDPYCPKKGEDTKIEKKAEVSPVQEQAQDLKTGSQGPMVLIEQPAQEPTPEPKPEPTPEPKPKQEKKSDPEVAAFDLSYRDIADSVHQSIANLLYLATKGQCKVDDESMGRLNRAGAGLLKKYDEEGLLLKYAPEIAYACTLAGVATEIMMDLKEKKKYDVRTESAPIG